MKAYRILTVTTVCVLAIFTGTSYGTATGINILSQTYHVWGSTGYPATQSYDITGANPVSGSCQPVQIGAISVFASSMTGDFMVDTQTGGSDRLDPPPSPNYWAHSNAQVDYTFRPQTNSLQVAFSGYATSYHPSYPATPLVFVLEDLDTSVILDSRSWAWYPYTGDGRWEVWINGYHIYPYGQGKILADSGSYTVNPNHTYSMTLSCWAAVQDDGGMHDHLEAVVTPEPATLLLLGVGGMLIRKEKNKK